MPVALPLVMSTLHHHLNSEVSPGQPVHVLLIEENDEMQRMLKDAFRARGWMVTECENVIRLFQHFVYGASAESDSEYEELYDVVVSDIHMPGMSSRDFMETIESVRGKNACPPLIVLSSFADTETRAWAMKVGAAALFDKPFDVGQLTEKVHELAQVQERR